MTAAYNSCHRLAPLSTVDFGRRACFYCNETAHRTPVLVARQGKNVTFVNCV